MQSEDMEEAEILKEESDDVEDPLDAAHPSAMVMEHEGCIVYQCPECDREFDTERAFSLHAEKHENIKNGKFQCQHCSKCCITKPFLRSHLWKAHKIIVELENPKRRAYTKKTNSSYCQICKKTFLTAHNYKSHMRRHRHLESGKYTCEFCQKSYGTKSELNRHIRMHPPMGICERSEIPRYCKNCNKHYASDVSFEHHLKYSMKKGQQIKQLKTHAEKEANAKKLQDHDYASASSTLDPTQLLRIELETGD